MILPNNRRRSNPTVKAKQAKKPQKTSEDGDGMIDQANTIRIPVGDVVVEGNLTVPHNARGIVLFAHGSGSSRFSPRNQYVSKEFVNARKSATLLFDLLTSEEEDRGHSDGGI